MSVAVEKSVEKNTGLSYWLINYNLFEPILHKDIKFLLNII